MEKAPGAADAAGVSSSSSIHSSQSDDFEVASGGSVGIARPPSPIIVPGVMDVLDEPQESPRNAATGHVDNYRNSFTADSPYFSAFADHELKSLNVLGRTLQEVSERTKTFVRTGELMSEAARRLSSTCMLRGVNDGSESDDEDKRESEEALRREAVGEEMSKLLELLGEVRTVVENSG